MPWTETTPVDERLQFVTDAQSDRFTMAALCARYGVSRRVGYKWVHRYAEEGRRGLADRSRAPHHSPQAIASDVAELLCALRTAHPQWGARKLLRILRDRHPRVPHWPAASTAADLLARRGLVHKRRTRRPTLHPGVVAPTTEAPNDLWTADFKGQFRLGNGALCFPLTIVDAHSRYLLVCRGLKSTAVKPARRIFEEAFREYGLPEVIHTDNGVPFCAPGSILGLSSLSVWFLKLGIALERSRPGKPQDNGAHERMHRTLKEEVAFPASRNEAAQQRALNRFRQVYNEVRPHGSIGRIPPRRFAHLHRRQADDGGFTAPVRHSFLELRRPDLEDTAGFDNRGVEQLRARAERGRARGAAVRARRADRRSRRTQAARDRSDPGWSGSTRRRRGRHRSRSSARPSRRHPAG
mgnify:CR=1 FL=1